MRLTACLLGTLLVMSLPEADAGPSRRNAGMITLPIRAVQGRNTGDLHPQLYLQQHINHGDRRLARMTGREGPTDDDLRARLHKRTSILGVGPVRPRSMPGGTGAGGADAAFQAATGTRTGRGASPLDIQAGEAGGLTKANPPTADNSLGLDIEAADVGYTAQLQLGTPPHNFEVLIDSGSADFWVGSENCKSEAGGGCGNHQFLGPQSSSTFKDTGVPFAITYGTGKATGTIVQDDLNLAGLQLKGHTFGTAGTESVSLSSDQTPFDGLMGFAHSGISQQQTPTPVEALAAHGLITDAITSYKLSRLADQKNDGEITFGGLDKTKFEQTTLVTLSNVNAHGFWEANMDTVTVDGQSINLHGRTGVFDTGTTLIIAPRDDVVAIHKLIQGAASDSQGGFTVPCTTTQSVALSFGGTSFTIDPRDLTALPIDPNNPTGNCTSGIATGHVGDSWLVGDVFLKNAYFSTDVGKNTISLAKLV